MPGFKIGSSFVISSSPGIDSGRGKSLISIPAAFTSRWSLPFNLYSSAGSYSTDLVYPTLKPAITKTYYIKSTGSDAANGASNAPLLNLSTALAKNDVDEIVIDCSAGDYFMWGSKGWNNVQPTRSLSIRVIGPGRAISIVSSANVAPTWTSVGNNVYKTTMVLTSGYSVTDISVSESDGFFQRLNHVANTAAVETPGSCYYDGTDLFAKASDNRNLIGDQFMAVSRHTNNMRVPSANLTLYVDGVDFIGGIPFQYVSAGAVDPFVICTNCRFMSSHNQNANAIGITGPGRFYFYRVGAGRGHRDQFNYHGDVNGDPKVFENECYTGFGGYVGTSDNASTAHENTAIVRLNGRYILPLNRVVADINDTRTLILGGYIGQARTVSSAMECLAQQQTNKSWIAGVNIQAGSNPQLTLTANTVTLAYKNMSTPGRAGTGEDLGVLTLGW